MLADVIEVLRLTVIGWIEPRRHASAVGRDQRFELERCTAQECFTGWCSINIKPNWNQRLGVVRRRSEQRSCLSSVHPDAPASWCATGGPAAQGEDPLHRTGRRARAQRIVSRGNAPISPTSSPKLTLSSSP